jgi:hypothetical protein
MYELIYYSLVLYKKVSKNNKNQTTSNKKNQTKKINKKNKKEYINTIFLFFFVCLLAFNYEHHNIRMYHVIFQHLIQCNL